MNKNAALILRGLKVIGKFPKPVLLSKTLSAVFNAIVPFINIYFSAQILNELAGARELNRLVFLVIVTISLNLAATLIKSGLLRWSEYCDKLSWNLIIKLYSDKLLSMDYIDIENPAIQQQVSQIREHHNGLGFGFSRLTWSYDGIVKGIMQIILSIGMAFSLFTFKVPENSPFTYLDSPLAIVVVLLILALSIFLAPYLSMIGGKIWAKASDNNNEGNRIFGFYFFDMLQGSARAKDIRIYDQKGIISKGASSWFRNNGFVWLKYAIYNGKFSAASTGISYLSNGLIYLYVSLKALAGAFGVGGIVQYVGAITQFSDGFHSVLTNVGVLVNNNPFLDKSFQFLDIPNKKYQGTLSVEKRDDNDYEIEFRNVSFKYPGSEKYTLKNISLKLIVGTRMAVVGMNGSGKTTMIKLLCRLYDPTDGIITLNGVDIKKYNYDEYMAIFSVVFQDFKLLPFTLAQNVAASVDYNAKKITDSLSKSGFDTRLENMSNGIATYLYKNFEEDGVEVSGGEAQKIALARALYKDAPFVILDEPTAALDPIAEYEIYSKFNDIVGSKTALYISHRLSSCRFCNDIAVFHEGEIIQRGSHDALITNISGKYFELWNAQAQYYDEKAVQV